MSAVIRSRGNGSITNLQKIIGALRHAQWGWTRQLKKQIMLPIFFFS